MFISKHVKKDSTIFSTDTSGLLPCDKVQWSKEKFAEASDGLESTDSIFSRIIFTRNRQCHKTRQVTGDVALQP